MNLSSRDNNSNLRTQLTRIIEKAGLKPWPKLFQNLRATRATELAERFPGHVAAAWLGHSVQIAKTNYWQVTDDHFEAATEKALHYALQTVRDQGGLGGTQKNERAIKPEIDVISHVLSHLKVAAEGLEPPTRGL